MDEIEIQGKSKVQVCPVENKRDFERFLRFPWTIYGNDPLWVPPILPERKAILDPKRGEFFLRGGEAKLFLAIKEGRIVGTIAAAEDCSANTRDATKHCIFGFFEYINDLDVARALIETVEEWGHSRGLTELYGPFNLDYENAYGVLVEGRDRPPVLLCGHTPPYYLSTMEILGFLPARGDNIAIEIRLDKPIPDRAKLASLAASAREHRGYSIRNANFFRFEDEVNCVLELLNKSLAHLPGFIAWEKPAVRALLEPFRSFADPRLVLFAMKEGKTVGFFPAVPNLNEVLIKCDGFRTPYAALSGLIRMSLFSHPRTPEMRGIRRFLSRRYECVTIKSVLVPPEHWGAGAAALLFDEMIRRLEGLGYSWIDLSLTSEDNPNTPALAERFGGKIYKRYRVFRKAIGSY